MHLTLELPQEIITTKLCVGLSLFSADFHMLLRGMKDVTRFVLITDENVHRIVGKRLAAHLQDAGLTVHSITFPTGESYKTRETKQQIEEAMLKAQVGRDSAILALGGGVVTDVAGFVAATYCRGIPYLCLPTTLLGMVDASIGGKTGVNTLQGKNLIGSFHFPRAVVMDLDMLTSLSEKEWTNGMAECLKHGMIGDRVLFDMLMHQIPKEDREFLTEMVGRNCALKKRVVEEDPEERGMRRILNFGHTIGHGLESVEVYAISHGEAIAIGMIVEAWISVRMGYLAQEAFDQITQCFHTHRFPLKISRAVTAEKMRESMKLDKKTTDSHPRFVMLKAIGAVESFGGAYCSTIPTSVLDEALAWMIDVFQEEE